MNAPTDRSLLWAALAVLFICAAAPISNPDLFWHLSAARRMLALRSIPSADWLSWSMPGAPWTDFEWGSQLIYGVLHHVFGMGGLWVFKCLQVLGAAWILWKTLEFYGLAMPYRSAALAFWSAASLTRSDLRPEWFSVIAFGLLFWQLETRRLGRRVPGPVWAVPFFGAWANLHAGVAFGVLLTGIYAAAETAQKSKIFTPARAGVHHKEKSLCMDSRFRGNDEVGKFRHPGFSLWLYLTAAIVGTLLQPAGFSLYAVLWSHWTKLGLLQSYIAEWAGVSLKDVWHWPYWILLFASFGFALRYALRTGKASLGPFMSLFYYSYSAFKHLRLAAYDVTLATPLSGYYASESRALPDPKLAKARWGCLGIIALSAFLTFHHAHAMGTFHQVFNDQYVPVLAAKFLQQEKTVLSQHVFYNDQWGWGGYLGYKLYPDYRVFQDGRYIFHPLLPEVADAVQDPQSWAQFMDRRKVEVAVLENIPRLMDMTRVYPDGSRRDFLRPYYIAYMPRSRWTLVYWDDKALIFVRNGAVSPEWVRRHEFKYALPYDREAREDVLKRKEIPAGRVQAELLRHSLEILDLLHT